MHSAKPSPGGEGGPLAVDEVVDRHIYTSSVTFGDSFSSRRSLLFPTLKAVRVRGHIHFAFYILHFALFIGQLPDKLKFDKTKEVARLGNTP